VAVDRIINMLSLGKFIDTLEDGYATLVGERGNLLSGGQKQRVLLARAMLYDSAYLFLDEPTSALDNRTEENVVKMLEKLKGKKTIIITTHRQSLLSLADTVFEIADKTLTRGH
jgi:ABC-type bacteriocin/lantibiotic exporter with double-glycine peptidase domain